MEEAIEWYAASLSGTPPQGKVFEANEPEIR